MARKPTEKQLEVYRFHLYNCTQEEIATILGITQSAVCQRLLGLRKNFPNLFFSPIIPETPIKVFSLDKVNNPRVKIKF